MSSELYYFLRPNWPKESRLLVCELEKLVFMALNVDYERFSYIDEKIQRVLKEDFKNIWIWRQMQQDLYLDNYELDNAIAEVQYIYEKSCDMLEIAINHIEHGGLFVRKAGKEHKKDKIKLVDFGDWASSVGFELPDEFPRTIKEQVSVQELYQQLGINNQQQNLEEKKEVNRTHISRHAANTRWGDDPKAYAMRKAYEEWLRADKSGGYRSKLAAHLLENVDGIKGVLTNQKYLAEKFGKWDKGEELPEC